MRIVVDTNIIISGTFWFGPPRQILEAARTQQVELCTSPALLEELTRVISRSKFAPRLLRNGETVQEVLQTFAALTTIVHPTAVPPIIHADPDDDAVLACAVAAGAEAIVSGDHHLLDLISHHGIPILTVSQLLGRVNP
jgi:putative PIN family toxin of toxin-antitoxin system